MTIKPLPEVFKHFPYKELGIGLMLIKLFIDTLVDARQFRRLGAKKKLPSELEGLKITEQEYQDARVYERAKMKFGFISDGITSAIEVCIMYFNYYPFLWEVCRVFLDDMGYGSDEEYLLATVFIIIDTFRSVFLNLPFSIYKTFVLEEKFGFNKSTKGTFIKDQIIQTILKIVFVPLIFVIIIFVIQIGGEHFYFYAEIAMIVIAFIALWLYPNFIAPLLNKFEELEEGEIRTALYKLAESVKFPLTKIYVMDASRRTAHSNAYLFGFWKNKRIVLYDTLVK